MKKNTKTDIENLTNEQLNDEINKELSKDTDQQSKIIRDYREYINWGAFDRRPSQDSVAFQQEAAYYDTVGEAKKIIEESSNAHAGAAEDNASQENTLSQNTVVVFGTPADTINPFKIATPVMKKRSRIERVYIPKIDDSKIAPLSSAALTPSDNEDFDNVKDAIKVLRSDESTLVFAVIIDKNNADKNVVSAIRCYGGMAFGGYAYDLASDSYLVQCVDFAQFGVIPFSFVITMSNVGNWQVKIPMPGNILEKYFNVVQRRILDSLHKKFSADKYEINFIQMLGCNC